MPSAQQIANEFIGAAEKNPQARSEIFRQAAYTFMGLAHEPKNARQSRALSEIGLAFANATHNITPVTIDDFTDVLQETQQAYEEVGNADPLDLIAHRRLVHELRTPPAPGHVSIAPSSFTRDATLGRSAKIKFQPTPEETVNGVQQTQTVAFWQGEKKEAQAMTVDVNLVSGFNFNPPQNPDENVPVFAVRVYAEVTYGSDGNRTTVRFDIGAGKRCTVVGNYISVAMLAVFPGVAKNGEQNLTTPIEAGASIGPFAAPTPAPLVFTAYLDTQIGSSEIIAAGFDSDFIPIPAKAVLLLPILTDATIGGATEVDFFNFGKQLLYTAFYSQPANAVTVPVTLSGDAAFVRIRNIGNAAAKYRLPFQLAM